MFWTSVLVIYRLIIPIMCNDIITRDFHLFTKKMCRTGCSTITCHPNTLIFIDSIDQYRSSVESQCNPNELQYFSQEYSCHFKFIENHIFKTCANTYSCEVCPDKIEMKMVEPQSLCSSKVDFIVKYRCIPALIKNDNICAHSYLDLKCFDRLNEKLVIINSTILSKIKVTSEDTIGCPQTNSVQFRASSDCRRMEKTYQAMSKCSFRDTCSIGPNEFTPKHCGNMHMKISYACVPSEALSSFNKQIQKFEKPIISIPNSEPKDEDISWLTKQKWKILGISSSIMVVLSVIISLLCFYTKRKHDKHNFHVNGPRDNLFNKLGQVQFSPPPSSIDKVNLEFDSDLLGSSDLYNCHTDSDDPNIRSIYSTNIPSTLSYNSQFCIPAPVIKTCQYFSPLMSPSRHINMLEMPPIQQASSGNLTSSTNSSHGTPRGTKSSGIFSMNETSFEMCHQV